jgi:hypothetical protein
VVTSHSRCEHASFERAYDLIVADVGGPLHVLRDDKPYDPIDCVDIEKYPRTERIDLDSVPIAVESALCLCTVKLLGVESAAGTTGTVPAVPQRRL